MWMSTLINFQPLRIFSISHFSFHCWEKNNFPVMNFLKDLKDLYEILHLLTTKHYAISKLIKMYCPIFLPIEKLLCCPTYSMYDAFDMNVYFAALRISYETTFIEEKWNENKTWIYKRSERLFNIYYIRLRVFCPS